VLKHAVQICNVKNLSVFVIGGCVKLTAGLPESDGVHAVAGPDFDARDDPVEVEVSERVTSGKLEIGKVSSAGAAHPKL
jgi:hypothetical protein